MKSLFLQFYKKYWCVLNYLSLLKQYPLIKKLSILQFIAYFGAWFSSVAIYTMLVDFSSSAFVISMVTVMHLLPAVVIAPFSGVIIDKFKIKNLLFSLLLIELCMTLLLLLIDEPSQIWLLMVIVFIRMTAASIFFSAEMSLLPKLVRGIALQKANEIHSIIWSFTYAVGMGLSGLVVNYFGIKTAIILDASVFVIALVYFSGIDFKIEAEEHKEKFFAMIKDGLLYIKKSKMVIHLIILHASVGLTSFDTLITLLAKNEYKYVIAVPLALGISNAVRALALMIGPFFISKYLNKESLVYLFIFQGSAIILWAVFQNNFYFSLVTLFFVGLCTTSIWSYTYALLQEKVERKYLGRVISYNDMVFMLSNVCTTLFVGLMSSYLSLQIISGILGAMFFVVAYYYKFLVKHL